MKRKDNDEEKRNSIIIAGLASEFEFSHRIGDEKFYRSTIACMRKSGAVDTIPIIIPKRMIPESTGPFTARAEGEIRVNKNYALPRSPYVATYIKPNEFCILDETGEDVNEVRLNGYICREPRFYVHGDGRKSTTLILKIDRENDKWDTIPCVFWGRNAEYANSFEVGDHIKVKGCLQSRCYNGKRLEGGTELRISYEVAVRSVKKIKPEEKDGSE